jgi:hypothetical protein
MPRIHFTLLARHAVEVEACARGFEKVLGRERVPAAREAEEREEDAGRGGGGAEDDVAGVPDRCSSGVSICTVVLVKQVKWRGVNWR